MDKLKFNCSHCESKLEADYDLIGETATCPRCNQEFIVSSLLDDAQEILRTHRREFPDLSEFDRARIFLQKREYQVAKKILFHADLSADQRFLLEIEMYYWQEKWETAKKLAEVFIEQHPQSPFGYRWLAEILDDGFQERQQSVEYSTKAIELDRNYAEAYVIRGNTKRWMKPADNEGARRDYESALQINPQESSAYSGIGFVHLNAGRLETALDFFETSMKYDTFSVNYGSRQGATSAAYQLGKSNEQVIKWMFESLGMSGEKWFVYHTVADIFFDMAEKSHVKEFYDLAVRYACHGIAACPAETDRDLSMEIIIYKALTRMNELD